MRARRRRIALLAALALLAGCGRFGSEDGSDPVAGGDPVADPFDDLRVEPTTTSAPATTTTSTTTAAPPPTAPPATAAGPVVRRDGIENQSIVEEDGWRLRLLVGERAEHRTDERVLIEAELTNISDHTRYHEVEQPDLVVMVALDDPDVRAWSSRRCRPPSGATPALGLRAMQPGEAVPFRTEYPMGAGRPEECVLPPGDYAVVARIAFCPDEAVVETANPGTYVCEDGAVEFFESVAVPLRLR